MGKRLSENLSSLYIGAANKLKPKCSRRKIIAYVESYDDISFWRTLLGEYENETRYFEVMLPSKTTLAKGKKSVLIIMVLRKFFVSELWADLQEDMQISVM